LKSGNLGVCDLKPIRYTLHASQRLLAYEISKDEVSVCVRNPDRVLDGYKGRKIAQRSRNSHLVRVIYEENELIIIVTVYLARKARYEG
jgi:hypothetical protein